MYPTDDPRQVDAFVVCTRHPDFSNEFEVYGGEVYVIDIDHGYSDLNNPDEFADWAEHHMTTAKRLRESGVPAAIEAAQSIEDQIKQAEEDYNWDPGNVKARGA